MSNSTGVSSTGVSSTGISSTGVSSTGARPGYREEKREHKYGEP